MVIDSSAIVAQILGEEDAPVLEQRMARSRQSWMSAVPALECRMVLHRRLGHVGIEMLERVLQVARITIVPFDAHQVSIAFEAHARFGKGSGHPARLNLGDCAAYALAITRGEPLLYKGGDFALTDVTPAL